MGGKIVGGKGGPLRAAVRLGKDDVHLSPPTKHAVACAVRLTVGVPSVDSERLHLRSRHADRPFGTQVSQTARRASALAVHLDMARAERDREAEGRRDALAEVERLRAEVVRLHTRVQVLEEAEAARALTRRRGLASLIHAEPDEARPA